MQSMVEVLRSRLFVVWLAALVLAPGAMVPSVMAQQPSPELTRLREETREHYQAGYHARALQLAEQALPLVIRQYGPAHEQTSIQYFSLGLISQAAGKLPAAEKHFAATLRLREKLYGRDSPAVADSLDRLGAVYVKMGQLNAAEPLFRRALKIRQDAVGRDHAFSAVGHANLGDVALARGQWAAARASYREAIRLLTGQDTSFEIVKQIVEDQIKGLRDTFIGLCQAVWQLRGEPGADKAQMLDETFIAAQQAWRTSAASALAKMTARLGTSDTELGRQIRAVQDTSDQVLALHAQDHKLLADWSAVQRGDRAYSAELEAFRAASIARNRDQAPTIKRQRELVEQLNTLLQRCPPGESRAGCEKADRQREAISKELGALSQVSAKGAGDMMAIHARMAAAEKALPGYAEFTARRAALREDINRTDKSTKAARAAITQSFPDFLALSDPRPLSVATVQALLQGDEALVAILVGSGKSFVWAVTRERAEWAQIDAGAAALAEHVTALRRGLDPQAQRDAEGSAGSRPGIVQGFDLTRAHALYKLVLGPVASVLAGKRHLIVVPTGSLTSLPFQVLLTAPPGTESGADAFRNASWLIKSHALSVLPSVQLLEALRKLAPSEKATQPFMGIGDPVLKGPFEAPGAEQRGAASTVPALFYRNGLANIRALQQLVPLPETADELLTIGKILGAPPNAIILREAASEKRVKEAALTEYRIIQFATHGLVAGDLSGLSEPALVLTPPTVPTDADDGLLTASEIAALKLNADWVVLSACNTAAGGAQGAEALSGLARAFFYAGARAMLVSHWAVYSQAATELTTTTFAALSADAKAGRAEAFRRAMLGLIAKGKSPSHWAPFVIVGEGGAAGR